jgi:hypothetical protein
VAGDPDLQKMRTQFANFERHTAAVIDPDRRLREN